ncbi:MAG: hypothetical protein CTY19_10765 [Methylomonas sp.]|nr:MAG: hypothetical protein CTY19_10765 [Methylomonas sp.]
MAGGSFDQVVYFEASGFPGGVCQSIGLFWEGAREIKNSNFARFGQCSGDIDGYYRIEQVLSRILKA